MCHIDDTVALYIDILRKILSQEEIDCGRNGYYLASPGAVAWSDLYKKMAIAMAKHGAVDDDSVHEASNESLEEASKALECPKEFVPVEMGGTYVSMILFAVLIEAALTVFADVHCKPTAGRRLDGRPSIPPIISLNAQIMRWSSF